MAGEEFGKLKGHLLIVQKALYGLRSSGKQWWERLSEILSELGLVQTKAEPDIWYKKTHNHYEYIARYVDDIAIVSESLKTLLVP